MGWRGRKLWSDSHMGKEIFVVFRRTQGNIRHSFHCLQVGEGRVAEAKAAEASKLSTDQLQIPFVSCSVLIGYGV